MIEIRGSNSAASEENANFDLTTLKETLTQSFNLHVCYDAETVKQGCFVFEESPQRRYVGEQRMAGMIQGRNIKFSVVTRGARNVDFVINIENILTKTFTERAHFSALAQTLVDLHIHVSETNAFVCCFLKTMQPIEINGRKLLDTKIIQRLVERMEICTPKKIEVLK